jgi:CheY-like chemotaxis protein
MEDLIRRTVGPEITVEVVGAGGLWITSVDQNQFENALLNLCINARDAMTRGGRLTIETANTWLDDHAARQHDLAAGQYVSVSVTDTGEGMSSDVIAQAFDPFFTTKPAGKGTGLGLSMVYGFCKQSGGQVRIYSELQHGTTVTLYLQRHSGKEAQTTFVTEACEISRARGSETVLIVDDEPGVRSVIEEVLNELGYVSLQADDGAAGLLILKSSQNIDLLITDIGLPGKMNGRELAQAASYLRPEMKILFITGYAQNAVIGNGYLGPTSHILTKPFRLDVLADRIKGILSESTESGERLTSYVDRVAGEKPADASV